MVAAVLLEVNGQELTATEASGVANTPALASAKLKEKAYAARLKANSHKSR
jgi:hypothetical protein